MGKCSLISANAASSDTAHRSVSLSVFLGPRGHLHFVMQTYSANRRVVYEIPPVAVVEDEVKTLGHDDTFSKIAA